MRCINCNKEIGDAITCPHCGALAFSEYLKKRQNTNHIVICHTGVSTPHTVLDVHKWHRKSSFAGIGYHYFINKKGEVHQGRPAEYVGAFSKAANRDSVGVCFEGDFRKEVLDFQKMPYEVSELLALLCFRYHADIVFYDEIGTNPPLNGFPKNEIRENIAEILYKLASENERVFGSIEAQHFYEWLDERLDYYGIPYFPTEPDELAESR